MAELTEIDWKDIVHRLMQKGSGLSLAYNADETTRREATRLACNFCFDLAREIEGKIRASTLVERLRNEDSSLNCEAADLIEELQEVIRHG